MDSVPDLSGLIAPIVDAVPDAIAPDRRFVVALAGPPAAGKSSLAAALVTALAPRAALVGLDAWHFDDAILEARGHRDRKGAPHTFEVAGYAHTIERLASGRSAVAVPVFDRSRELSRNAAAIVEAHHEVVITEGNWLLLDQAPWSGLAGLFDLTAFVAAPDRVVEERIFGRWRTQGLTDAQARRRAEHNDLPNAAVVRSRSRVADLRVTTG